MPAPEPPLTRLGDYKVLAPISQGGMATVYVGQSRAHPENLVALKVIRQEHCRNAEFVAMFLDEARITSHLSHPNIVTIHGHASEGTRHYLVMELLRGRTLFDVCLAAQARETRLAPEVVAWIGARIAGALHYVHELRDEKGQPLLAIHRDVSPSNVFVTEDGLPKIIDFGLAKARDRLTATLAGVVKGKLAYLAPEQTLGRPADRRADIFALGVTLWEAAMGRRLFKEDDDVQTVRRVQAAEVPSPATLVPGFPEELAAVLMHALAKEHGARFATAEELEKALDAFARGSGKLVDASTVKRAVTELFPGAPRAAWEKAIPSAASRPPPVGTVRLRAWEGAATAPSDLGDERHSAASTHDARRTALDRSIAQRIASIDGRADPVGMARALAERAVVDEILGDGARAIELAQASWSAASTVFTHAMLRRLLHKHGAEGALLQHLDAEIDGAIEDFARADLLAERARLLSAAGKPWTEVAAAWERALAVSPEHPAALRGLAGALFGHAEARERLAAHLGRMAEVYGSDPKLAAWLRVEEARLLDEMGGRTDAARAALERALAMDSGIGPVRAACVRHAVAHRNAAWFVELLSSEAGLEMDPRRAARLELDAAAAARHRLGDAARAVLLLERAARRAPTTTTVDDAVRDELIALHQEGKAHEDVLRVRRSRLAASADPRARLLERRAIAAVEESLGRVDAAVAELESAHAEAPEDVGLLEELDRLLEAGAKHARRAELWAARAARTASGADRASALVRAARLSLSAGDRATALVSLRAALVANPENEQAVDMLARLLATPPPRATADQARDRVTVYAVAADNARDVGRRVAYLEAIAMLEEELLGEAALACRTFESILRLEPKRRSAILGMGRTAARAGDDARLIRALLAEAEITAEARVRDDLRVRAAEAMITSDAERAVAMARDVLGRTPAHSGARLVEQRLHERAGRWLEVARTMAARVEHLADAAARTELRLAMVEVQRTRLSDTDAALVTLRAALTEDREHPAVRAAIVALLESRPDPRGLRDGLVELAKTAGTAAERARLLGRAAEIDELLLLDDGHAAELLGRALAEAPDDDGLRERQLRVLYRRARAGGKENGRPALLAALEARYALYPENTALALDFALALLDGGDATRASALIESVFGGEATAPSALLTLERVARQTGSVPLLANAMAQQAEATRCTPARLGCLWEEAALVEWRMPNAEAEAIVLAILKGAPADGAALDAVLRYALPKVRRGDASSLARVASALRIRRAQSPDETGQLLSRISLGLVLELGETPEDLAEALVHYREALRIDPRSAAAAPGAARLGAALGDDEASVTALTALADLAQDGKTAARLRTAAAEKLLATSDARLGTAKERRARAATLLESSLDADPDATAAVTNLVALYLEQGLRDRLMSVLRAAFARAGDAEAIGRLGTEIARIACVDPPDRATAIDALRRVLVAAPGHVPTLRALADLFIAESAWPEAAETLEQISERAADAPPKLDALTRLADVYSRFLHRPAEAERALRAALVVDHANVRVLRELISLRRANGAPNEELAALLARIGAAEDSDDARATALVELAELRLGSGDVAGGEHALIEGLALTGRAALLTRLMGLHAGSAGEQVRILTLVAKRSEALQRPDAATFARLGQLEVDAIGNFPEGVAHLRVAVALAPTAHEARAALARGLVQLRGGAEAVQLLSAMITPDAAPLLSLKDPAAALHTLERAFTVDARTEEAIVTRELRAVAGGLDDGAHVELRSRRISPDAEAAPPALFDAESLRSQLVPPEASRLLLDLAAAIMGADGKLVRTDTDELGVNKRDLFPSASREPLAVRARRVARMLGLESALVAESDHVARTRVAMVDGVPWIIAPRKLSQRPEPEQTAELCCVMTRIALGFPWLDELPGAYAHAVLCAAGRQVISHYADDLPDPGQEELIAEYTRRMGKAIGRKQKKLLAELGPDLAEKPAPTRADVDALLTQIARTELRAAYVVTGDLLATLDELRHTDPAFAAQTSSVGPRALGATLAHHLAGDVARFAMTPAATSLRWNAGTVWTRTSSKR